MTEGEALPRRTRVAAYGICEDDRGRVLLCRSRFGPWFLPGGGLEWGESPAQAFERELAEETGLGGAVTSLELVHSNVIRDGRGAEVHYISIVYRARTDGTELRYEVDGSTDFAAWLERDEIAALPLAPAVRVALGLES
jgi:8-oxo-dGTP diphosphatase